MGKIEWNLNWMVQWKELTSLSRLGTSVESEIEDEVIEATIAIVTGSSSSQ